MSFTYTRDIPDGPHNPSADQGPMKVNTNSIDDLIDVDHFSFLQGNDGKHKQTHLVSSGSFNPPPATVAGEGTIYTADTTGGVGSPNPAVNAFYTNENSGNFWQLTNVYDSGFATFATNPGWTFLPGGLFMAYGTVSSTTSGTVSLPSGLFLKQMYNVQTTAFYTGAAPNGSATVSIRSTSSTSFNWNFHTSSGAYAGFHWVAIGF